MSTAAVAVLLVASMLAVGTAASLDDFRALAARRAVVAIAVAVNVIVLPGLAVGLVNTVGLAPDVTLGVMLAASAPGGGTGALLTLHARGDLAVSAGLQVLLAPVGLVSIPVWAAVAGQSVVPAGGAGLLVVGGGLFGQLVPLAVGMWLRRSRPPVAQRVHRVARRAADVLLAGLVLYFVITGAGRLPQVGWVAVAVIAALVAASLTPLALPGPGPVRRAVAMTTGVRNLTLALFFAATAAAAVVLAVLAYGLLMYGICVPVALALSRAKPAVGSRPGP